MMIPAPTVVSLDARSSTTTGSPARPSSRARESPPIPPPTTIVVRGIGGRGSGREAGQRGQSLRLDQARPRFVRRPALETARRRPPPLAGGGVAHPAFGNDA